MASHRTDYGMCVRTKEVLEDRIRETHIPVRHLCKQLGLCTTSLYGWCRGEFAPSTDALRRLAVNGFDVMYILTGRRSNAQQDH